MEGINVHVLKDDNEFMKSLNPATVEMDLIRSKSTTEPSKAWCIVMEINPVRKSSIIPKNIYLYLTVNDSSYVFSQVSDGNNVAYWNKEECLHTVDYIVTQRNVKVPNSHGTVRAYNKYTGQLI